MRLGPARRSTQRTAAWGWLLGAAGLALGCTGYVESGSGSTSGKSDPASLPPASANGDPNGNANIRPECTTSPSGAEARLRRLSRTQYDRTLRELGLLGDTESLAVGSFTGDSTVGGRKHGYTLGGPVDPVLARDLLDAAISVASSPAVARLFGCTPSSPNDEEACARTFIGSFGRRAFRRALSPAEQDELMSVFAAVRSEVDFQGGVQAVVAALLSAPEFLYLVEGQGGDAGTVVPVEGVALASRLSYFLWDSMPDEALLTDAEAGKLVSIEGVRAAAERMLGDERAHQTVNRFLREWTGIDGLTDAQKAGAESGGVNAWYTPELVAALQASFLNALENTFFATQPMLRQLLGDSTMLVDTRIASAYGLPAAGAALEARPMPAERLGFLTHPAFMALQAKPTRGDPIHRGLFVREQLLCEELPDPPVTDKDGNPIVFNVGETGPGVTNRQRFKEHTASAECAACHTLIDPLGFGFENYDALGRYRTADQDGNAIDASGEVLGSDDLAGAFNGASELVARLAGSKTVGDCLAVQWFRYALSRDEAGDDHCALEAVQTRFAETGGNLREMLVALAVSDAFRFRKVGAP